MPTKQNDYSKCEQSHEKNQVQNNKQNQNVKCEPNTEQSKGCSAEPAECSNNNSAALLGDNENSGKNTTKMTDITLGIFSVVVGLFYFFAKVGNYQIPSLDRIKDLLSNGYTQGIAIVVLLAVAIVFAIRAKKLIDNLANFLGEEKFSSDIKLFIIPVIVIAVILIIFMLSRHTYCFNNYVALISITAILYITQINKTIAKNHYDQLKIELDYMPDEKKYIDNVIGTSSLKEETKEFTKNKSLLKYYNRMKNNYECIMILYIALGMYMGFGKLG